MIRCRCQFQMAVVVELPHGHHIRLDPSIIGRPAALKLASKRENSLYIPKEGAN